MDKYLIVCPIQYGYNTDFYKYSEWLSCENEVYYVGFDKGLPKRTSSKVHVYELKYNKQFWLFSIFKFVYTLSKNNTFKGVLVYNFIFCHLLRLFFPVNILVMDVRTSYITSKIKTWILNKDIWFESLFFKKVSLISYGVGELLGINKKKSYLLPLGSDPGVKSDKKSVKGVKLLYVGTFYKRDIEKTIEGFSIFLKSMPLLTPENISYTIIGNGPQEDCGKIKCAISKFKLEKYVNYVGEVRFEALVPYFTTHNVGVSFIPQTIYYDCQPPTKTFEYLLNSMAVIGTNTTENRNVLNENNGVLVEDNPNSFSEGLSNIYCNIQNFDFLQIYNNSLIYTWENITRNDLMLIFNS